MIATELAEILNGRQFKDETTPEIERKAKQAGLIIITGYSDDVVSLYGALSDEVSAWEGASFSINREGVLPTWESEPEKTYEEAREFFRQESLLSVKVTALWCAPDQPCWTFETEAPHETFEIMEDGQVFSRGIIIDMAEVYED